MKGWQFKLVALLWVFISYANQSYAQSFKINLSDRHVAKIEKVKAAPQKLKKYHKYYSKDSAQHMRKLSKLWKKKSDSITNAMVAKEKLRLYREKLGIKEPIDTLAMLKQYAGLLSKDSTLSVLLKDKASEQVEKNANTILPNEQQEQIKAFQSQWGFSPSDAKQYLAGDTAARKKMKVEALQGKEKSLAGLPPGQRKQVEAYQKEYGAYSKEMKQYLIFLKDSIHRYDTLKSLAAAKAEGFAENAISNNFMNNDILKQLNEFTKIMAEMKNSPIEYQRKLQQYNSKETLEKEAKDFVKKNPEMLKVVQKEMSLMIKKYSSVQSSNDLSTAIKRTSLKDKPLRERLLVALNFQVLNLQPVSIDFAPTIGYKFNSRFTAGIGGTYRQTFNDSIPLLSPNVWGFKAFASYDVINSYLVYGECGLNSPGVRTIEGASKRIWDVAFLAGIGKRFPLHKNLDMTVMVLYNLLRHSKDSIYPNPLIFRIGFQLNDLALRKK